MQERIKAILNEHSLTKAKRPLFKYSERVTYITPCLLNSHIGPIRSWSGAVLLRNQRGKKLRFSNQFIIMLTPTRMKRYP